MLRLPPAPKGTVCLVALFSMAACGPSPDADAPAPGTPAARAAAAEEAAEATADSLADARLAATPYDFAGPAAAFSLPAVLQEISGLTVLDDEQLGAVQDEEGDLYAIRMKDGEPVGRIRFGRGGDYEGLERVGDIVYVLQSDGDLFELRDWNRGKFPKTRNFETRLGAKACDAEGLGAKGEQLFIACKEEDGDKRTRVYSFDPERAVTALHLTVDPGDVPGEGDLRVSALAFHPVTGHMVLLSVERELLISVTSEGEVADVWDLGPAKLEQPEGLAFLPNGDVFIASESKAGAGRVVRFDYRGE